MNICVRIVIKGRVQGVGFRWFARENAEKFGLTGYVKNLMSGDVEVLVEGEQDLVDQYLSLLKQGPPFSHVVETEIERCTAQNQFKRFQVLF